MLGANSNDRIPSDGSDPVRPVNRLAGRIRRYSDRRPGLAREQLLPEAMQRAIHFRGPVETAMGVGPARRYGDGPNRRLNVRAPLSPEDIRLHSWLAERLAVVHHERHGLWPRLRRFLFGNRLARWLGLQPQRIGIGRKQ